MLSLFALGLGTTFPISVVSLQNSVARSQIGTVTGAMNFFRALMASFTVAAFHRDPADGAGRGHLARRRTSRRREFDPGCRHDHGVPLCVRRRGRAMLAGATLCMIVMEERPLAGPPTPAEMAE